MADAGSRGKRLQIMLTADELTILDDFQFRLRMPSRAATVRELFKRGLAAEGFEAAAFGTKSEEFGVARRSPGPQVQIKYGVPIWNFQGLCALRLHAPA